MLFWSVKLNSPLHLRKSENKVDFQSSDVANRPAKLLHQFVRRQTFRHFTAWSISMKRVSRRHAGELVTSNSDNLKRLYSDVQRLKSLLGVLKCGSAAGAATYTAADERSKNPTIH
jgi:hypothetical protein